MTCPVGRTYTDDHPTCRSCERQGGICQGTLQKKASKYRSKKVIVDGQTFDSKKEYARWNILKFMEMAGTITVLKRQVVFLLQDSVVLDGRKKPAIRYIADFVYQQKGQQIVEDVKSKATRRLPTYRLKKHLMKSALGIEIKEV